MQLVVRCQFSDYAIALLQYIANHDNLQFKKIHVVCIDTGWAAKQWQPRVVQGMALANKLGFNVIQIKAPVRFDELIIERGSFPNRKFQWCASFLKGLPLINWLDQNDPSLQFSVAIPKTNLRVGYQLKDLPECEYHGDRQVIFPIKYLNERQINDLVIQAGFKPGMLKSLECSPCVLNSNQEVAQLDAQDMSKLKMLQSKVKQPMFAAMGFDLNYSSLKLNKTSDTYMSAQGCALPFGCGL